MDKNIFKRAGAQQVTVQYVIFAMVILLPLLGYGYVQTIDMAWGPYIPQVGMADSTWLLHKVLGAFSAVISSMLVQKLVLLGIFAGAGLGAHRLANLHHNLDSRAAYAAGLLYTVNPFVYTRLMAGQWLVLIGYALLPWAMAAVWRTLQKPTPKQSSISALWLIAIGLTSIHAIGIVAVAWLCLLIASGGQHLRQKLLATGVVAASWLAASSIWLVPLFAGSSGRLERISGFGHSQLTAFASQGSVIGSVPLSTLLLEGFWADGQNRYRLPSQLGWGWGIVAVLLAAVVLYGVVEIIRNRDRLGYGLLLSGAIGWWLAMGIGSSWSAGTTLWLHDNIPLFRGYREPQKWLMLLALAYAYAFSIGAMNIWRRLKNNTVNQLAIGGVLVLPLLFTPLLLYGGAGQLHAAAYPAGYGQAAAYLNQNAGNAKVLVLPWHLYLPLGFTGRVVAQPATHYFRQPLVVSSNAELYGLPTQQTTADGRFVAEKLLPLRGRAGTAAQLKSRNIGYVLVQKEADWQQYGWTATNDTLDLIFDNASLQLYAVRESPR